MLLKVLSATQISNSMSVKALSFSVASPTFLDQSLELAQLLSVWKAVLG